MKNMKNTLLVLFLSTFLLSGNTIALGAKGDGMNGKGAGMGTGEQSMEKHDGKMMQEGTTMKDGGMKTGEMKEDDMKQNEGTMIKDKGMQKDSGMHKDSGMMKGRDSMK